MLSNASRSGIPRSPLRGLLRGRSSLLLAGVVFAAACTGAGAAEAGAAPRQAIVVIPAVWTDPASHHVFHLDPTGAADISDGLNLWLARGVTTGAIPPGTQQMPTIIQFPFKAQYRLEDGLQIGASPSDLLVPGLPRYRVAHVVIDMNSGRIFQSDDTAYKAGHPAIQPRRRYGVQLVRMRFADDVTLENGTIQGHHLTPSDSTYSPRAAWHGIQISGSTDIVVRNMAIDDVWGDFVYLGEAVDASVRPEVLHHDADIVIENVTMDENGRQGITVNDADGLVVRDSSIQAIERFVFDSEPVGGAIIRNVTLEHNTWDGGGQGFMNMNAPRTVIVGNLAVVANTWLKGHIHINIAGSSVVRHGLTVVGNTASDTLASRTALVDALGWTGVTVTGNSDLVVPHVAPLKLTPGGVTVPNHFA